MGWEYRAVEWTSHDPDYDKVFMRHRAKLIAEGWEEHLRAGWRPSLTGGACIMRRPKDEPRKWTKAEVEEIARGTQGPVLNERVMQADLCGRLEKRNVGLQAALRCSGKHSRLGGRGHTNTSGCMPISLSAGDEQGGNISG